MEKNRSRSKKKRDEKYLGEARREKKEISLGREKVSISKRRRGIRGEGEKRRGGGRDGWREGRDGRSNPRVSEQ